MKKYLITQDVGILLGQWGKSKGMNVPGQEYFDDVSNSLVVDLQTMFDESPEVVKVQLLPHDEFNKAIEAKVQDFESCFLVSFDKVFCQNGYNLEINRVVSRNGSNWESKGECHRPGCKMLAEQFREITLASRGKPVVLFDDGCWTGGSIRFVTEGLKKEGTKVSHIVVGLMIGESPNFGAQVTSIFHFDSNAVLDWICERDFFPGVPFGGKTVLCEYCDCDRSLGAYYLFAMGDYDKWASLSFEEGVVKWFTMRCLHRTAEIFKEIEAINNRPVFVEDLARLPYGINFQNGDRFVDVLNKKLLEI